MSHEFTARSTSYGLIAKRAYPIILANSATPLLGLVDTAVIGRTGSTASLGAIALGALIFSFVYWTFGFLRMGTTGLVAQANGSGDEEELRAVLARSMLMAVGIGLILILLQIPIFQLALALISGSEEVESSAETYLKFRIWGAPAALVSYAILGGLIGMGRSRTLLFVQVVLNTLNIVLDVLLAGYFGLGVMGIALGTMIAEWTAGLLALALLVQILRSRKRDEAPFWSWAGIMDTRHLGRTIWIQLNIMIRTLCLLIGFGWFTQQGARLGDVTLAANHILLQFISFSAFFLDGVAYATEGLVGTAAGARRLDIFKILVQRTGLLAGVIAMLLTVGLVLLGGQFVGLLTDLEEVRTTAVSMLPYTCVYIFCSFATFQLDGIFIGVTRTREMRNAAIASLILFLALGWPLTSNFGNVGLWWAFIAFILLRAATLGFFYPGLTRSIAQDQVPG